MKLLFILLLGLGFTQTEWTTKYFNHSFTCTNGDWETTAPPTLRVQWQDLN